MELGFRGLHPIANLIFFISITVFGMLFRHPLTVAVCFIAALVYYIRLCRKSAAKTFLCFLLPTLVAVTLINMFFSHYGATRLFGLPGGNSVTFESLFYGFLLGASAVSIMMWFFCYNETVTTDKFLHVFGRALPAAALVVSMALRLIPVYRNRLSVIADGQSGIGKGAESGKLSDRVKNGSDMISVLITWSLENAVETSDAMRSRGYGLKGRTSYSRFEWRIKDILSTVFMLLLDVVMTAGYAAKAVSCVYNPCVVINPAADLQKAYTINALNITLNPLSVSGVLTLAAFCLLAFLPLIIDLKEELKWKRLKLKI